MPRSAALVDDLGSAATPPTRRGRVDVPVHVLAADPDTRRG
jgi:hypothetical protein